MEELVFIGLEDLDCLSQPMLAAAQDVNMVPDATGLISISFLKAVGSPIPIQPESPQPTRAAPSVDGLEAAITQAEVEKALPKLSNGKATGRAG